MINHTEATGKQNEKVRKIIIKRNICILMFLLMGPFVAVTQRIAESDQFIIIAAFSGMVVVGYYLLFVAFVKCPRCKNHFFSKWYGSKAFSMRCIHCGLEGKK